MTRILAAKPVVEKDTQGLKEKVSGLKKSGISPRLEVILVGDHPPSLLYTKNKKKFCQTLGIECEIIHLDGDTNEQTLLSTIERGNEGPHVHGQFIQLPLPPHLHRVPIKDLILPEKDVDGLHLQNVGRLCQGEDESRLLTPCTPKGILRLLHYYEIPLSGKDVTIIGRSPLVGTPLSLMMTNHNATVTLCHSKTVNLQKFTRISDIIVSAVGRPHFIDKSFIGSNRPTVIDVGINTIEGRLCGDVSFHEIKGLCSAITPVPGGVGPMTVLSLAQNVVAAAQSCGRRSRGS
ncbi:MAG: bifunctional 5,10-methylenetetrahydrofolate dehydrogenase/5,10-methenyltetrahydrofolate cyclohydrolase [Bacteriovoracales bacterium]|nr:bifunctional 5,10-methylenetetrahydrofolate dehydrogenase/5,10-methenyltetrahydrofolate cyclohydrolase [Bacteriovoracales bacterium]